MNKFIKVFSSVLPILFFSFSVSAQQTAPVEIAALEASDAPAMEMQQENRDENRKKRRRRH